MSLTAWRPPASWQIFDTSWRMSVTMVWVFKISSVLRGRVSGDQAETDRTHVEDVEESVQVRFPLRNHILVAPGVYKSSEPVPLTSFHNLLLYFGNGPAITSTISGRTGDVHRWLNLRCQLINRVTHRLAEIIQFPFPHSPLKGFAYIGAGQTESDIILFVDHRVLETCKPGILCRRRGGDSLGS